MLLHISMQRHSEGRRVRATAAGEVQEMQKRSGIMAAARESRRGVF